MTIDRRSFLKGIIGAVIAPLVAMSAPKPEPNPDYLYIGSWEPIDGIRLDPQLHVYEYKEYGHSVTITKRALEESPLESAEFARALDRHLMAQNIFDKRREWYGAETKKRR